MKEIALNSSRISKQNHGKYKALVDDEDFDRLYEFKWHIKINNGNIYARAIVNGKLIYMHNYITGLNRVDHIDNNGLNNQKANLRLTNPSLNAMNQRIRAHGTSKYKGVSLRKRKCKHKTYTYWVAQICKNQKVYYLGTFPTEELAGVSYNNAAKRLFGEYAKLNELGA